MTEETRMTIQYAMSTFPGDRECNEDCVKAIDIEKGYCFVVADGLGGHGKGEVASLLVCEEATHYFETADVEDIFGIFDVAQEKLLQKQKDEYVIDAMKTTMNVVTISQEKIRWGHVGDTRTYYFKKHKLVSRTKDHSVPQMMVSMGEIKEKDIRHHEDRNRLLKVMGTEWTRPQYTIESILKQEKGQAFLICTDGFWELIEEKEMLKSLKKSKTPQEWLDKMNEIVKRNGSGYDMDNYTALAVWID